MTQSILKVHRFLVSQLFYPVLLSSALAFSTYVVRVIVSGAAVVYANLVWNLFLAWIPYLVSVFSAWLQRNYPGRWWLHLLPLAIWMVFFPNAPYIVTDFLHLAQRPSIPLWYDILMLATFSWTGLFLAIASLRTYQIIIKSYLGVLFSWLFALGALFLGGLGIYLGRFERWNTWDLLFHSKSILADISSRLSNPFDNLRFFGFTILFSAFLFVCYFMFVSIRHLDETR